MALSTGTTGIGGFLPADYSDVVWAVALEQSVALQVTTVLRTSANEVHYPVITGLTDASWVAELATIPESQTSHEELIVTPKKVAALTTVSNELVNSSDPAILNQIPTALAGDMARKIDAALFSNPAPANAPAGLNSVTFSEVDANGYTNLDPFLEAQSDAAALGAQITAFVTNPATALTVRSLKTGTGSNAYLLDISGADVTIAGVPLYVSPAVEAGVVWAIPQAHVHTAASAVNEIAVNEFSEFDRYATQIRAVSRVAFGVTYEAAVVKIHEIA